MRPTLSLRTLSPKILVERDERPRRTAGGIELLGPHKSDCSGIVVAVHDTSTLVPGSRVIFTAESWQPVTINDDQYAILNEDDCLAVLE